MILRPYQEEAVETLWSYLSESDGHPLIAVPTGGGKSLIIAAFLQRAHTQFPKTRTLVLQHVKELIVQNREELLNLWPSAPCGTFSAGLRVRQAHYPITFAGIASVAKHPHIFGRLDLVIIDEAHLVSPKEGTYYQRLIGALKERNPNIRVIGLSATPFRLGQGLLTDPGGLFTDLIYDCTSKDAFNLLIEQGYLTTLIPKRTAASLDVSGVKFSGGDYNQKELQIAVDIQSVTEAACDEMIAQGEDRKHWLVFASGISHAIHIAAALNERGIRTTLVHSRQSDAERDEAIRGFKLGRYRAIVSMGILTVGFNFPPIGLVGMLRPTASAVLWVQALGRATRPAPGKVNALVLDFAGNTRRLGPVNDPVIPRRKGPKGKGDAPVKVCEECGCYNHASVRICVYCGSEFPKAVKIMSQASEAPLIAQDEPEVEEFDVDHVSYRRHHKVGGHDSLKVTYFCGLRQFGEYICLEHGGFAGRKAGEWWKDHSDAKKPETVDAALAIADSLRVPQKITVWLNQRYPSILSSSFDSSVSGV